MRSKLWTAALIAIVASTATAQAQSQKQTAPMAQATAYKPLAMTAPTEMNDAAFISLRNQLGDIAKKRDAAALSKLVVGTGFFWDRDKGDVASKRRSGLENLSAALSLSNKDSAGWDMLAGYAEDPTASPSPGRKGAVCAPAEPVYDAAAFDRLLKATQSDATEWGYPVSTGIEVHLTAAANAPVIEKLGLHFVRVMPETKPSSAAYQRIVTPSGKTGFVSIDAIAPFGNDQICYVKEAGVWKIGGYIGGGEPQ